MPKSKDVQFKVTKKSKLPNKMFSVSIEGKVKHQTPFTDVISEARKTLLGKNKEILSWQMRIKDEKNSHYVIGANGMIRPKKK